jgi:hypothetical protein
MLRLSTGDTGGRFDEIRTGGMTASEGIFVHHCSANEGVRSISIISVSPTQDEVLATDLSGYPDLF